MKYIFTSWLLFVTFLGWGIDPQNDRAVKKGDLVGVVKDATGKPLEGISVLLKGTLRGALTDATGKYMLKSVPIGTYTVVLQSVFVKSQEKEVNIKAGQVVVVDFESVEVSQLLEEVRISGVRSMASLDKLPEANLEGIFAAKKTEIVHLDALNANLVTNNSRQIFSKTPGVMVWENDGSGIQVGVSVRGLSPNRSWEFNVRQNGYDVSSDPFGYPEAYYNPPMEAVERIEVVRGAAGLQYGAQFGGLLNYVLKTAPNKPFGFETQQSVGSYGTFSSFNSVGGTVGRLSYFGYFHHRQADGWRQNSQFFVNHGFGSLKYTLTPKLSLGFELTRMYNESQQAGGLTDAQFAQDARQSTRSRNWFSTPWTMPVLTADYLIAANTKLTWKAFGLWGQRNSVGFVRGLDVADTPNAQGNYANRQVDRDSYKNFGSELRLVTDYKLLNKTHTLSSGVRYFVGNTLREQQGVGTNAHDFDLTIQTALFPRKTEYQNTNLSFFAENLWRLNEKIALTSGLRYESLYTTGSGYLSTNANGTQNAMPQQSSTRHFVLLGVGGEYHVSKHTEFYTNWSQAYRPVLFSDLVPPATTDVIDANLQDARGWNFDLGYRGKVGHWLNWDINYFRLHYDNRIGTITQLNPATNARFQLRTNLGQSRSEGVESFVEVSPTQLLQAKHWGQLSLFASMAFIHAHYSDFKTTTIANDRIVEGNLSGKRVENAPRYIHRWGATYARKGLSLTWQLSSVGDAFADASNTVAANATATTGLIPAYQVQDVSASYQFLKRFNLKASVNNLTDERYFTRRAGGYPGPGLLPADGRTFLVSLGMKL